MSRLKRQEVEWTLLDMYPGHWGARMTTASVTSALRSSEYGERETWCDLLSELLEGDPHSHAVVKKSYSKLAEQDYELVPAQHDSPKDQRNAELISVHVKKRIDDIPMWHSRLFQLLWGHFTGLQSHELMWGFGDDGWYIKELKPVPSRRSHYNDGFEPYFTNNGTGSRKLLFSEFPAKFIVFQPIVTGDTPTREGLARVIVYWLAFKRWAVRELMAYTERYGKPTPIVTYKTGRERADEDDITLASTMIEDIGRGTQPGGYIPDTLTMDFANAGGTGAMSGKDKTVHHAMIELCNAEISKAVAGNTLTTEVGSSGGNRALGEVHSGEQESIQAAIARQLDETITRDLVYWIVALDFGPDAADKYCPSYHTKIEEGEDLESAARVLDTLVKLGLKVPSSEVYARFGWRAPANGEEVLKGPPSPVAMPPKPEDDEEDEPEDKPDSEPEPDNDEDDDDKDAPVDGEGDDT